MKEKPKFLTRILAFIGAHCPFCVTARKFPQTMYARAVKRLGVFCPFCTAYQKLKSSEVFCKEVRKEDGNTHA